MTMRLVSLAITVSLAFGCGGSSSDSVTEKPIEPATGEGTDTDLDNPAPVGPNAEEAFAWVLAKLESGGELTEAESTEWFAPEFLKAVPYPKLAAAMKQFSALKPFKVLKKEPAGEGKLSVLLDTVQGGARLGIGVNDAKPRKIDGLVIKPAMAEVSPKSYGDAVAILKESAAKTMFSVSEIKKGKCTPHQNSDATQRLGIGSSFKLWILAALQRKIDRSKKITWDTKITIKDELKSLPTGVLQNQPAGTELTLREVATKMISISDNTATDHLLDYVGRKDVEKMLKLAKHGKPALNIPFMSSREFFTLKLGSTADEIAAYKQASTSKKRKALVALHKKELTIAMAKDWKTPRHLDLEWFADGRDLCNVMATIGAKAKWKTDSETLKMLAVNAGVPFDKTQWKYLGFKGGSEPGVINLTYLLQRADNRWFVVAISANDEAKAVDEKAVVNVAVGTLNILGAEK